MFTTSQDNKIQAITRFTELERVRQLQLSERFSIRKKRSLCTGDTMHSILTAEDYYVRQMSL